MVQFCVTFQNLKALWIIKTDNSFFNLNIALSNMKIFS